ncbi:MAG: 30S ribosomal protein S1 [Deltaproteobacteria bacterium]|nr:30S ribosomal protein S1 [Deltaproteobacteria bacterium]
MESFEELLEQNLAGTERLKPGQMVEAKIVDITPDWIFLDLGGKSEGYLDVKELMDSEGQLSVSVGDSVTAYFLSSRNNEMLFTTRIGRGESGRQFLEQAYRNRIPVEGQVEKEVKGGFQVRLAGKTRAFCPFSQMGMQRIENPGEYEGRHLSFIITEYGEKGRNIIISNRAVMEEELRKKKEELRGTLQEGMRIKGKVTSVQKFGAFVDLDGIQGLIPISEMCWGRVERISDHISPGDEVEVVILHLDWEKDRISLSMKATLPDPWDSVQKKYIEGATYSGVIARLAKFGAFVTLEDGVDGLVHISKLGRGRRINHPSDVVEEGQRMDVVVESVDAENRRISLALPVSAGEGERGAEKKDDEEYHEYMVDTASPSMGTLGDILKNRMKDETKKK